MREAGRSEDALWKMDTSPTGVSAVLCHASPLRPERSWHCWDPNALSSLIPACAVSQERNGRGWVFGMDYSSLLASSSHLLIVDDGPGGFAREPVFNLLCLLGPKRARGNYSP